MPAPTFANPVFVRAYTTMTPAVQQYPCVVFCGRSNVGKSSVINALCNGKFARVSRTPGRTQSINLFALGGGSGGYFADLPGYGYAAVSKTQQNRWQIQLAKFITHAPIRCLLLIIDARRGIVAADETLLALYRPRRLPLHILLNKADKLNRRDQQQILTTTQTALTATDGTGSVITPTADSVTTTVTLFSATKGTGIPETKKLIRPHL